MKRIRLGSAFATMEEQVATGSWRSPIATLDCWARMDCCDSNIGLVLKAVEDTGEMDNTLIIYIQGDNGASAEGTLQGLANEIGVAANGVEESEEYLLSIMDDLGGPMAYNHYPVGWAHAMDTPFQWTKQVDGNVFAHDEKTQFLNAAFRANLCLFPAAPYTAMGAGVTLLPTKWLTISTLVLDNDPDGAVMEYGSDGPRLMEDRS